jgi:hypothetical protein
LGYAGSQGFERAIRLPALRLTLHSSVGLLAPSGFARAAIKTGDIPAAVGSRRPATTRSWARISARLDRRGRRLNGLKIELIIVDNESAPEGSGANDQITTIESRPVFLYLTVEKNLGSGADDPQLLATGRAPSWRAPLIVMARAFDRLRRVPARTGADHPGEHVGIDDIRRQSTTIPMVEQNADLALQIADRVRDADRARIVLAGNARSS